jgi:hypothetical protein
MGAMLTKLGHISLHQNGDEHDSRQALTLLRGVKLCRGREGEEIEVQPKE